VRALHERVHRVPWVQCRQPSARQRLILAAALRPPLSPVQVDAAARVAGRDAWRADRPGWTEAGWWDVAMLPEVRALLSLPKGPALLTALQDVPALDGTGCSFPHEGPDIPGTPRPGTVGAPCPCQVIVAAAWATAAAWVADHADHAVIATLGASEQVEVTRTSKRALTASPSRLDRHGWWQRRVGTRCRARSPRSLARPAVNERKVGAPVERGFRSQGAGQGRAAAGSPVDPG
jgi:hypothetical protein